MRPAGLLAGSARALNRLRLVLVNLVFFGLLAAVGLALVLVLRRPPVPDSAALVLAPEGELVEQFSDPLGRARLRVLGEPGLKQTKLADLLRAIEAARDDARIKAIVLDTEEFGGGGLPALQAVRAALLAFRQTGKQVYAIGGSYDQAQYYLASAADSILLSPDGEVRITGFAQYQPYFKGLLERLHIDVHVFRVGRYKSAVEPFTREDMSAPAREETRAYLDALWRAYQHDVAQARRLPEDAIDRYATRAVPLLEGTRGDAAKLALDAGLVTVLASPSRVERLLIEAVGEDHERGGYNAIDMDDYLAAVGPARRERRSAHEIALVTAAGEITQSGQAGTLDADATIALLREAQHDEHIKAVVLRIDSPGGSASASERILDALQAVKAAGKPVVVSMANVAASGGYWIAMGGDEIWAAPTTLTGSIGIFGIFPTFDKLLDRLDVRVSGLGTTPLAGRFSPLLPLAPEARRLFELGVERGYRDFVERVAAYRHLDPARVEQIAQGRVWTGAQAQALGLVDHLGGLDEALGTAAKRAGLRDWTVQRMSPPLGPGARLLSALAGNRRVVELLGTAPPAATGTALYQRLLARLADEARALAALADPRGLYADCLCDWRLGRS